MKNKLQDSEIKVMNVIWAEQPVSASRVSEILKGQIGWNVNTTYTLIKRCIDKGAVERTDPGFVCTALVSREEIQQEETETLIDKIFDGSADKLFAALLGSKKLSRTEIDKLKELIDEADETSVVKEG